MSTYEDDIKKKYFADYSPDKKRKTNKAYANVEPIRKNALRIRKAKDIEPKKIEWLFEQMFPIGEVSIIAGDPGVGKSTLLIQIASLVTNGSRFKAGIFDFPVPQGNVLVLSQEDHPETVLIPRLIAAEGNKDFYHVVEGQQSIDEVSGLVFEDPIRLDMDISALHEAANNIGNVKLIIIDPISGYLGDIDETKNSSVRRLMSKLTGLARLHNCVILLNTHLSKGSSNPNMKAMGRVMGSIGYTAAARAVYLVTRHELMPDKKRVVGCFKNNYGDDKNGFAYEIEKFVINETINTSRVILLPEHITQNASDMMQDEETKSNQTEIQRAITFLFNMLKNGNKKSKDIKIMADKMDISSATLQRARTRLKIQIDEGQCDKKDTIWYLSTESPTEIS